MVGRATSLLFAFALLAASSASASEDDIKRGIVDFFRTTNVATRAEIAAKIEADSAFDRAKMSAWLHAAGLFSKLEPGSRDITVRLETGDDRTVTLRIPKGYDPAKPYPLLYLLHGTGASGPQLISYYEHVLATRIDEFIVAAPTGYNERVVHDEMRASDEHPRVLREVRKLAHIDAGRQYVSGYSLGGHTSWTLAVLHADEFAAAIPIAGSFILPEVDRLWPEFIPNLAHTHILCCWGAKDSLDTGGSVESEHGGVAGMDRKLIALCQKNKISAFGVEDPERGHGGIVPPAEELWAALSKRREMYPLNVNHLFRFTYQGRCYWLEAFAWKGPAWVDTTLKGELREGETPQDMLAREIRSRLARLTGKIDGQKIRVDRKQIDDFIIWIGDGMIDWSQPVELNVNGQKSFTGELRPSVFVCLTDAAASYDFDRLRWAGLRFVGGQKTRILDAATPWPVKSFTPKK